MGVSAPLAELHIDDGAHDADDGPLAHATVHVVVRSLLERAALGLLGVCHQLFSSNAEAPPTISLSSVVMDP